MKTPILLASLALLAAVPSLASASTGCREARHDNRVAGTVVGAIAGGLLGNAVSHGGGRSGGTAIGAVGGAVIGNQIGAGQPCPQGYEAYQVDDQRPRDQYQGDQRQGGYRQGDYRDGQHYDSHRYSNRDEERAHFDQDWRDRGATWDRHWTRGERLPGDYVSDGRYYVADYRAYGLSRPPRGYHWVAYGDDFLQIRSDGLVRRRVARSDR